MLVLLWAAAVSQVAACDDQLGVDALDEVGDTELEAPAIVGSDVEIREVKESCPRGCHFRGTLYTENRGR